jgi:dTDP-4-amino-4,6-dideoxygalactose transaminase
MALQGLPGVGVQPFADLTPPAVLSVSLATDAEKTACRLAEAGIETRRWYAPPLHRHQPFASVERTDLPVTKSLYRNSLGLPFHSFLSKDDVLAVVEKLQVIGN